MIGVCVSGGPDSMAMAYLLKQIPRVDSRIRIEPLAFIVNHNAREGSMQEVISVSRQLEKLGMLVSSATFFMLIFRRYPKQDSQYGMAEKVRSPFIV